MNEAGAIIRDHWPWLLGGVAVLAFIVLLAVVGLILFTKWVVHIEFSNLTNALHKDIGNRLSDINAKLELIARTEWSDIALGRKFADVDTVTRSNMDRLSESQETVRLLEDEQDSLRAKIKDHDERLRVVEAWKDRINDMTIIRSGF